MGKLRFKTKVKQPKQISEKLKTIPVTGIELLDNLVKCGFAFEDIGDDNIVQYKITYQIGSHKHSLLVKAQDIKKNRIRKITRIMARYFKNDLRKILKGQSENTKKSASEKDAENGRTDKNLFQQDADVRRLPV